MKLSTLSAVAILCSGIEVSALTAYSRSFYCEFLGTAVSWGTDRIDLFGLEGRVGNVVWHKTYDGVKKVWKSEQLDLFSGRDSYPVAITRGKDRLDVFTTFGGIMYQTWNGKKWLPEEGSEPDEDPQFLSEEGQGVPSVTSSDSDRVDVIVKTSEGHYGRKYFNGKAWLPEKQELEDLGADGFGEELFVSDPASVSWEKNSIDVFGVLSNGTLLHKYWNGQAWKPSAKGWQNWGNGFEPTVSPKVISRAEKTLEIFALKRLSPAFIQFETWYAKWDSSKNLTFDNLGGLGAGLSQGYGGIGAVGPAITYWDDRIDLFDTASLPQFSIAQHKWFAGGKWHPKNETENGESEPVWDEHKSTNRDGGFISVSTEKNNINLFFYDTDQNIRWQQWNNGVWSPKDGDSLKVENTPESAGIVHDLRERARAYRKSASAQAKSRSPKPLVDQTRVEHLGL